ncbi:MAG: asparagine synthase, partial [Bacillaceae bacterium]|nr:asparagine synthase [Bacillaceae bacterium]
SKEENRIKTVANTLFGIGLGHIVLGVIDLVEHRR